MSNYSIDGYPLNIRFNRRNELTETAIAADKDEQFDCERAIRRCADRRYWAEIRRSFETSVAWPIPEHQPDYQSLLIHPTALRRRRPGYIKQRRGEINGARLSGAAGVGVMPLEWMPIDTAPQDGTGIIVYHEDAGVCAAFCPQPGFAWYCMEETNTATVRKSRTTIPTMSSFLSPPTHWMPLPEPPDGVAKRS